jgi:hypothetical protein
LLGRRLVAGKRSSRDNLRLLARHSPASRPFISRATSWPPLVAIRRLVTILAMVPLALRADHRIADRRRRLVGYVTAACTLGAVAMAIAVAAFVQSGPETQAGRSSARSRSSGLAAAAPIQPGGLRGAASSSGRPPSRPSLRRRRHPMAL